MNALQKYRTEINNLCALYNVNKLYVFGSVLTDKFNAESDIDLIVNFKPIALLDYADNYFDFKFKLQEVLNHPIDLLEETALKNPYFIESVNKQRQLLYG